jgi:hypothetical protein
MSLRIRQIVLAARDLRSVVSQLTKVLDIEVCYNDPEVGHFGLENALMPIGHDGIVQFLEVVSPVEENTTAGRHLDRHGDSGYMLILQTDNFDSARARLDQHKVRIVWSSTHDDIRAMHLHPKDIGGAIVSIDQPTPPESWRWAGPNWRSHLKHSGAQRVISTTIESVDPSTMAARWSKVLGTNAPQVKSSVPSIDIQEGTLHFVPGARDVIAAFGIQVSDLPRSLDRARSLKLPINGNAVTICGTRFELSPN